NGRRGDGVRAAGGGARTGGRAIGGDRYTELCLRAAGDDGGGRGERDVDEPRRIAAHGDRRRRRIRFRATRARTVVHVPADTDGAVHLYVHNPPGDARRPRRDVRHFERDAGDTERRGVGEGGEGGGRRRRRVGDGDAYLLTKSQCSEVALARSDDGDQAHLDHRGGSSDRAGPRPDRYRILGCERGTGPGNEHLDAG